MDNVNDLEKESILGAEAEAALHSPAIMRAFADLREKYTRRWLNTPMTSQADREAAYFSIKAIEDLEIQLIGTGNNGKVADNKIAESKRRSTK